MYCLGCFVGSPDLANDAVQLGRSHVVHDAVDDRRRGVVAELPEGVRLDLAVELAVHARLGLRPSSVLLPDPRDNGDVHGEVHWVLVVVLPAAARDDPLLPLLVVLGDSPIPAIAGAGVHYTTLHRRPAKPPRGWHRWQGRFWSSYWDVHG